MNQTTRTLFLVIGAVVAGAALLLGGMFIGQSSLALAGYWPGGMMGANYMPVASGSAGSQTFSQMGQGMMGTYGPADPANSFSSPGMMGAGMISSGMMGGFGSSGLIDVAPLSLADAQQAVQDYLNGLDNADLELAEIMIFDNHAYAQIVEKSTGIGAMELLVDPVTKAVYPEYGPNMMWNLQYSPMSGYGMMGMVGMMGGSAQNFGGMMGNAAGSRPSAEISAEMPVSPEQAVAAAQEYLDAYLPGAEADNHTDAFYGYYTLHILRDGDVVGMLSVNGFTRQVFLHTWHGDFLEMAEGSHD